MNATFHGPGPDAVLWDFDGTLVDTEPVWQAAEYELMGDHGVPWSQDRAHAMTGMNLPASAEVLLAYLAEHGATTDFDPDSLVDWLVARVARRIYDMPTVPWCPGVPALLDELHEAGIPSALVSASYRSILDTVLHRLPGHTFAAVVAGDDVISGKPDPEPYELAAGRLGVDPRRCVALEDSIPGVASAAAAGAVVVALAATASHEPAPGRVLTDDLAGVTVDDLRQIWVTGRAALDTPADG